MQARAAASATAGPWSSFALLAGLTLALVAPLSAQRDRVRVDSRHRTTYALEAFAGGVDFGHFVKVLAPGDQMLQGSSALFGGEVKVLPERSYAVGGGILVRPWEKASVRAGATWMPTHFELRDDSGLDTGISDAEDTGDLSVLLLDLAVLYSVLDPGAKVAPYAIAGVAAGRWSADESAGPGGSGLLLADGSQWRLGGVGGAGLDIAVSDAVGLRLEFATFAIGNPFDGDDAFVLADPEASTIDEPSVTRVSRLTGGLVYRFGGGRDAKRRRGR
jgi:hypothetical protein